MDNNLNKIATLLYLNITISVLLRMAHNPNNINGQWRVFFFFFKESSGLLSIIANILLYIVGLNEKWQISKLNNLGQ